MESYLDSSKPLNRTVIVVVVAVLALILGGIWWLRHPVAPGGAGGFGGPGAPGGRPGAAGRPGGGFGQNGPVSVGVATVTRGDISLSINALGTVTPLATVTIKAQVGGQLVRFNFTEGQMVKAGQVLAEIDPRPYQAARDLVAAQLLRDQAQVANARVDLDRYQKLLSDNTISHQQYDTQMALVHQYEAGISADRAALEQAQINLDYCRIVSPVSGRVGLRQVDPGNIIPANAATGIAVVTQLQPISVVFTLPEDQIETLLKRINSGAQLPIDAYDRGLKEKLASGVLATTDNQIDTTTGTLKLRGKFDNADSGLFPNQFVNVRLMLDTAHDQLIVPAAAVLNGASGPFVYLVGADQKVSTRLVTTGPVDGDRTAIAKGVQEGDVVVVDGADQLRDGALVTVPTASPAAGAPGADPTRRHKRKRPDAP
jgi:multidrug efflux system membrane fusion protein